MAGQNLDDQMPLSHVDGSGSSVAFPAGNAFVSCSSIPFALGL